MNTLSKEYPAIPCVACLNGLILKIIAVVTMLLDHVAWVFYPENMLLHDIGRLAFPIFVFLIVEGFFGTKNVRKYEIRLLVFALVSEIPFDLAFSGIAFDFSYQNTFFTLLIGLVMLDVITAVRERIPQDAYGIILELVILVAFAALAFLVKSDYGAGGILIIYCFYRFRDMHVIKYILFALILILVYARETPYELFALFAIIPLLLYNGQRGFPRIRGPYGGTNRGAAYQVVRYAFYVFYPVHLIILYGIAVFTR